MTLNRSKPMPASRRKNRAPLLILASAAGATALFGALCHESMGQRNPVQEALLFPAQPLPHPLRMAKKPITLMLTPVVKAKKPVATPQPQPAPPKPAIAVVKAAVPKPPERKPDTYPFTIDLPIHDAAGNSVLGLTHAEFRAHSKGNQNVGFRVVQAQYIAATTQAMRQRTQRVVMLFDQSGSIANTDPNDARIPAAEKFLEKIKTTPVAVASFQDVMPTGWQGIVQLFSSTKSAAAAAKTLSGFTTSQAHSRAAIESLRGKVNGGTPLYAALLNAITVLGQQNDHRTRIVVCFSDGGNSDASVRMETVVEAAKQAQVRIYFVALGSAYSSDWSALKDIAHQTGGKLAEAQNAAQITQGFASLASEIQANTGFYRLTLEAQRKKPFQPGEVLQASVEPQRGRVPTPQGGQVAVKVARNHVVVPTTGGKE